jgi:hypothetical protein
VRSRLPRLRRAPGHRLRDRRADRPGHCGACGKVCTARANATAGCAAGKCAIGGCADGYLDCDKQVADGCEANTATDYAHCGSCGNACGTGFDCVNSACVAGTQKRVFVSSRSFQGNLGGLAGADAKCQALAQAAGLTGTFKAWLSDDTQSPATRFTHSGAPYVAVGQPVTIANGWAALTSGSIVSRIELTEMGVAATLNPDMTCPAPPPAPPGTYPFPVWTATGPSGTDVDANGTGLPLVSCTNWTSAGHDFGGRGNVVDPGSAWTDNLTCGPGLCSQYWPLYCFEQ